MNKMDWLSYALGFVTFLVINLIFAPMVWKRLRHQDKSQKEKINKMLTKYENQVEQQMEHLDEIKAGINVRRKCPNCGYELPLLKSEKYE